MKKCIGCGTTLQYTNKNEIGYTENKDNTLCQRCFKIKNYGTYQNVSLTNKDYNKILKTIPKSSIILYVTDILSLDCKDIENFQNVILIITKKDILPKSVKEEKIINYAKNLYPNITDIHIISSKTNEKIDELYNKIKKYKEVYLVGTTNSGKSSLINRLIKNYGDKETNQTVTTSMYPSTTLNKIMIKLKDITLIDTPGLINKDNIVNYLPPKDIKKITPKKEIKPKSCQIEGKGSLIIDNYLRINYDSKEKNSIVIYTSNTLNIKFVSSKNDTHLNYPHQKITLNKQKDIVIIGLGFIKCVKEINLDLYIINDVKPIIRNNMI